jgi:hypothetical protein
MAVGQIEDLRARPPPELICYHFKLAPVPGRLMASESWDKQDLASGLARDE